MQLKRMCCNVRNNCYYCYVRVVCSFCNTGFKTARSGAGKCPICGHKNIIKKNNKSANFLPTMVFAGIAFAMFIFSAIFIYRYDGRTSDPGGLFVSVSNVRITDSGYVIEGRVKNTSVITKSVPDLVFHIRNSQGVLLAREISLPPSGLAMPGSETRFRKIIGPKITGANRISVTFADR